MINDMKRFPRSLRGFTLIETFVAITILLTAIVGPLTIASRGLSSAFLAKQQTVASFLAQEGIEYVRFKRDTNALNGNPWLSGLSACTNAACYINAVTDSSASCGGACPPLRVNSSTGFYTYALSDPATEFTRSVQISSIGANEAQITSVVTWTTGSVVHRFTAAENILNWQ